MLMLEVLRTVHSISDVFFWFHAATFTFQSIDCHKRIFYIVTVTQDITLTSRVDLDNVTVNQHGKYLGQSVDHFVKKTRSRRHRGDMIKLYKIIKGI